MEFRLQFALTSEDFADYNLYTVWSAPELRKRRLGTFLTTLVYGFGLSVSSFFLGDWITGARRSLITGDLSPLKFSAALALVIAVGVYLTVASRTRHKVALMAQQEINHSILREHTYVFGDTGIQRSDLLSTSVYKWEAVVKYINTEKYYYLYLNAVHAIVIPKRVLPLLAERTAFEKLLAEKIGVTAALRSAGPVA